MTGASAKQTAVDRDDDRIARRHTRAIAAYAEALRAIDDGRAAPGSADAAQRELNDASRAYFRLA